MTTEINVGETERRWLVKPGIDWECLVDSNTKIRIKQGYPSDLQKSEEVAVRVRESVFPDM